MTPERKIWTIGMYAAFVLACLLALYSAWADGYRHGRHDAVQQAISRRTGGL